MLNIKSFLQKTKDTISGQITKTLQNDQFVTEVLDFPGMSLTVTRFIAGGSFANVYAVDRGEFVVKRQICANQSIVEDVAREYFIEQQLSTHSANIVKPYFLKVGDRIIQSPDDIRACTSNFPVTTLILMENCGTPLYSLLQKPGHLPEPALLVIFEGIINAFCAMANLQLLNRDGKIENVLIRNFSNLHELRSEQIKICDFGSATYDIYTDPLAFISSPTLRSDVEAGIQANTTPQYRAPEMIDLFCRMPIGFKADVFALGVIFYRLMYKKFPFPDGEILANFNCRWEFPEESHEYKSLGKYDEKPDIPIYSENVKEFVRRSLVKVVEARASIFELSSLASALTGQPAIEEGAFSAPEIQIGNRAHSNLISGEVQPNQLDFAWEEIGSTSDVSQTVSTTETFDAAQSNPAPMDPPIVQTEQQEANAFEEQFFFDAAPNEGQTYPQPEAPPTTPAVPITPSSENDFLAFDTMGSNTQMAPPVIEAGEHHTQSVPTLQLLDFVPVNAHVPSQPAAECSSPTTDSLLDFEASASIPALEKPAAEPPSLEEQPAPECSTHASIPAVKATAEHCGPDFLKVFETYTNSGQFPALNQPVVAECLDFIKKTTFAPFTQQNFTTSGLMRRYEALGFAIFATFSSKMFAEPDQTFARDILNAADAFSKQIESQKQPKFNAQAALQIARELTLIYKLIICFMQCRMEFQEVSSVYSRYQLEALEGFCRACEQVEKLRSAPLKQRQVGGAISLAIREAARLCLRLSREGDEEAELTAKTAYSALECEFSRFRELTNVKFELCEVLELLVL